MHAVKETLRGKNMKKITLKSYAKINLSLDVLGLLPNGYHMVEMIMQQVGLYDEVTVSMSDQMCEATEPEISITSSSGNIPLDDSNLAYKGAKVLLAALGEKAAEQEATQMHGNQQTAEDNADFISQLPNVKIHIHIEKNIPVAAGLAGGSGNGAAVMLGLNHLMGTPFSLKELCELGVKLGADVPFCIMGQAKANTHLSESINKDPLACTCALAQGIGEKLTPIKPLDCKVLLSKPKIGVSTAEVYKGIDAELGFEKPETEAQIKRESHIDTKSLIEAIEELKFEQISEKMQNMLELFTLKAYSSVMYTKNKIEQLGHADKVLMSGSGPTVFALYFENTGMEEDFEVLRVINEETYITETLI